MWYTLPWSRFEQTTSVVIGTDCIGSCKSNYHTITATVAPIILYESEQYTVNDHRLHNISIFKFNLELNIWDFYYLNRAKEKCSSELFIECYLNYGYCIN
jgi:hypothetical protein